MPVYLVTETAGAEVAGRKNPGTNEEIVLTPAQAEQPLRLGYVRRAKAAPAAAKPVETPSFAPKKGRRRRR